ncbi:MAG: hypothetical protein GC129_04615 [Proteobacteria bacterium]|nr:hypothetical protein [Pseudomonadota bacterium]
MTCISLMEYLEKEVFFPLLDARPEDFAGRELQLIGVQREAMEALREVYYPLVLEKDGLRLFLAAYSHLRFVSLWGAMRVLGFATPLDDAVQLGCLRIIYGGGSAVLTLVRNEKVARGLGRMVEAAGAVAMAVWHMRDYPVVLGA